MAAHGRSQQRKERKAFSQSGSCSRQRSVAGFARDSLRARACNGFLTCLWTNCRLSASTLSVRSERRSPGRIWTDDRVRPAELTGSDESKTQR